MINFVFWGTDEFSVAVLNELEKVGFLPSLVVTAPDRPKGRKLVLTASAVKVWARVRSIPVLQPSNPDDIKRFKFEKIPEVFIVASYGLIISKDVLDIPKRGALNVHPSLLPKYRGASPVQGAILNDDGETGVSIMLMDEKMDHGPILARETFKTKGKKGENGEILPAREIELKLAILGGRLLAKILPQWLNGAVETTAQDESKATYTKKIAKTDGLIDLENGNPRRNFLKIRAYDGWPGAYFFSSKAGRKIRVIIKEAEWQEGLVLKKVLPENRKEVSYDSFLQSVKKGGL
ncbi:MAG: methionyl-tRNA formyltransferase [bacterium]|nr:methionyl-tRNA formyltransferase [bacterium]